MMRVESPKYPGLLVLTPRVQFVDGVAEVDEETAEQLRKLPADMGVIIPDVDVEAPADETPAAEVDEDAGSSGVEPVERPSEEKRSPRRKAPVKEA
jgi:hypothetical protein